MESEVLGAAVASSASWGPLPWPSAPQFPRLHPRVPSALDSVGSAASSNPELAAAPKADSSAASGAVALLCGRHPRHLGDFLVSTADTPSPFDARPGPGPPPPSVSTN